MKTEMVCTNCGSGFIGGPGAKFCPACKKLKKTISRREERKRRKAVRQLEERRIILKGKGDKLRNAVLDLEKYNRKHGTNYSYGQAVRRRII